MRITKPRRNRLGGRDTRELQGSATQMMFREIVCDGKAFVAVAGEELANRL